MCPVKHGSEDEGQAEEREGEDEEAFPYTSAGADTVGGSSSSSNSGSSSGGGGEESATCLLHSGWQDVCGHVQQWL